MSRAESKAVFNGRELGGREQGVIYHARTGGWERQRGLMRLEVGCRGVIYHAPMRRRGCDGQPN